MKKIAYIFTAAAVAFSMTACHEKTEKSDIPTDSAETVSAPHADVDTLLVITMPANSIWGHLGEDTGMSVLEFVTDDGDTLYINRSNEDTGQDGIIQGSIRNYTDHFCITVTDDSTNLIKAVNVTELQEIWAEAKDGEIENTK